MKTRITKSAAIRHARENVSDLSRFGDGWIWLEYDPDKRGWRQSTSRPYWDAMRWRCAAMVAVAVEHMTEDADAASEAQNRYLDAPTPGRWTDYVTGGAK